MFSLLSFFHKNYDGEWIASDTIPFITKDGWLQYIDGYNLNKGDSNDLALALFLTKVEMGLAYKNITLEEALRYIHFPSHN